MEDTIYLLDFDTLDSILEKVSGTSKSVNRIEILNTGSKGSCITKTINIWSQIVNYISEKGSSPWVDLGWLWSSDNEQNSEYVEYLNSGCLDREIKSITSVEDYRNYLSCWNTNVHFNTGTFIRYNLAVEMSSEYGYILKLQIPRYSSFRPITQMRFLGKVKSLNLDKCKITEYSIQRGKSKYIPVVRYAVNLEVGSYYKEQDFKYEGTFYYLERESDFVLRFSTYRIYRNKFSAWHYMSKELGSCVTEWNPVYLLFSGLAGSDLRQTIKIANRYMIKARKVYGKYGDFWDPKTNKDHNGRYMTQFYSLEDFFDQELCHLARKLNTEILVFTHMVGKTRLVSEVLDVRPREHSFDNIYRIIAH